MTDAAHDHLLPEISDHQSFDNAEAAVDRLEQLYEAATAHLSQYFNIAVGQGRPAARVRAYYPEIRLTVSSHATVDSRLSFGHVAGPGT